MGPGQCQKNTKGTGDDILGHIKGLCPKGPYIKLFGTADLEGEASESHVKETVLLVMEESNLNVVPFLYIL